MPQQRRLRSETRAKGWKFRWPPLGVAALGLIPAREKADSEGLRRFESEGFMRGREGEAGSLRRR